MASTGRYISPRDLGVLIADLRLAPTIFQDRLLEFLEQQRIVLPVARVRWPIPLVIEAREGVPSVPPTDEEREQSTDLSEALRLWHRFDADSDLPHPFDRDDKPGRDLICMDVACGPFEPWESFRTNIRSEGDQPLYVPDAVDTYYHDWQVLLVADALDMGTRVIFDTPRPDLMKLALHDIRDLPADVAWQQVSFQGPRGLAQGLQWARYIDASARVESIRDRKFNAIARAYGSASFTLTGADQDDLNATHKRAADGALAAIGASPTELRAFLTYLCEHGMNGPGAVAKRSRPNTGARSRWPRAW
jgi:hypothetical protein